MTTAIDLTDATVAEVAAQLCEIERETGWARVGAIGRVVIDRFFDRDVSAWNNRQRGAACSLRRLAAHADCPLKKSALAEAIGVYVATLEDPALTTRKHVTPSHVACVLRLEPVIQRKLLAEAEEFGWSVRALEEKVRDVQHVGRSATCRPASEHARLRRQLEDAHALLRKVRLALDAFEAVDPAFGAALERALTELQEEATATRRSLTKSTKMMVEKNDRQARAPMCERPRLLA